MGFKGEPTSPLIVVQKSIFLVLGCKGQQCALCELGVQGAEPTSPLIEMQHRNVAQSLSKDRLKAIMRLVIHLGVRGECEIPPQGARGGDHEMVLPRTPCGHLYSKKPLYL